MRPACSAIAMLAAIGWAALAESGVLVPKLVWSGPEVTLLGGVSRDGRLLSYVDPSSHNLAIHEIASGKNRILTQAPAGSVEFAYFSAISYPGAGLRHVAASPDGKWLAAGVGGKSVALIPAAGGEARILPFEGLTEIEWGHELVGGKAAGLWRVPLD